ncbi:MAG: hypothetical protein JSV03_01155, partial [Planctomycetota bacterium]
MGTNIAAIWLCFILAGSPGDPSARLVASWDLIKSLDDQKAPISKLIRFIGTPQQMPDGVYFKGQGVEGLVYGTGHDRELCFQKDFTIVVRAAFDKPIDWHFANHDTLVSRWGERGDYSVLLRSDHSSKTLHLFLSPDGKQVLDYDLGYRVDRSGQFHDLTVVVGMGRDVTFYVDGRHHCTLRYPPVPSAVYDPPDNIPFAIGYNNDPAYNNVHETMNGTIAAVRIYRGALSARSIAAMSDVKAEQLKSKPSTISIDVNKPIGRVHPFVLGHFLEHFQNVIYGGIYEDNSPHSDEHGFRTDVIEAFKLLAPSAVRWPGGNYTSAYHWRWGAVPKKYRPTIYGDPVWRQTETHHFGTPEFIEFCRRIKAEPVICVGVGRDPRSPTAEEAAAWVRYCNAKQGPEADLRAEAGYPEPFNVLHWGLGNEVYGRWQVGGYRDPSEYAKDIVKFARAMREADPRIKFIVCGASFKADNTIWNKAVMTDEVLQLVDWISYHSYTHLAHIGPRLPHEVAMQRLMKIETDIEILADLNGKVSKRAGRKEPIKLAVDEWNEFGWDEKSVDNNARADIYDLSHALFTASFLNIMLRHANDVTMANYAQSINCRGLIYADKQGVILRSTYHVFKMYGTCAEGTSVSAQVNVPALDGSAAPVLDAAAVRSKDDSLNILVVNRDPAKEISCQMKL